MLGQAKVIAFVATAKPEDARHFYETILGLRFVEDSPFAIVFEAGSTMLRIQKVEAVTPVQGTSLGWEVADIRDAIQRLAATGVTFNRYKGLPQDELGIWTTPDGSAVAWFNDLDGNTLSLTQFAP